MVRILRSIGVVILLLGLLGWLLLHWIFAPPSPPKADETQFSLVDVTLINPTLNRLENTTLKVLDDRLSIGPSARSERTLDAYRGMYVLPGFVDMHAHTPPDNALKLTGHYGLLNLAYGITTIRDAGDLDGTSVPAARRVKATGAPHPNIISCGPFVSNGVSVWPNTLQLNVPDQAMDVVTQIAEAGHKCVKAYEGLTPELTAALIKAANELGLDVIGHVPVEYTIEQSGIVDVQHFFGVQPPMTLRGQSVVYRAGDWDGVGPQRLDELVAYLVENDIRNTPTLSLMDGLLSYADYETASEKSKAHMPALFPDVIWHPEHGLPVYRNIGAMKQAMIRAARPQKLTLLRRLSDAGAILHIGTDTGQPFTPPGTSYWRELRIFQEAGITPEKVLGYATVRARLSLGYTDIALEDGSTADFLIFESDPTETLANLDSLVAVVIGGELYTRETLQRAVEERLDHYNSWPLSAIADRSARRTISTSVSGFD